MAGSVLLFTDGGPPGPRWAEALRPGVEVPRGWWREVAGDGGVLGAGAAAVDKPRPEPLGGVGGPVPEHQQAACKAMALRNAVGGTIRRRRCGSVSGQRAGEPEAGDEAEDAEAGEHADP